MKKLLITSFIITLTFQAMYSQDLQTDTIRTNQGNLMINFVKHASIFFKSNDKIIYVDPVTSMGNYETYPKADLILVTHHHSDHLDFNAIDMIKKENTKIVLTQKCQELAENISNLIVVKNDDILNINGLEIEAIPAYNIEHKRENGEPYHIKGEGNGYIIKFGDKKVYVAGDTENTPEMKALENIDIAFLPMNLPYTMTPEMVSDAANSFRPQILYPYHYGQTDTSILLNLLKDEKDINVRIKKM